MKLLVPVKQVVDPNVRVRVKPDHQGVDKQNVKLSMNPFDEIALEEALRCREKGIANEVVIVSIGPESVKETLRHGLALGADRAIFIQSLETMCALMIAKALKIIISQENPQLCLMGKQSIDGDNNQTPQMLASLLQWPQATYASKLTFRDQGVEVDREIDGGIETIFVNLPAVISVDLRLNEPRYPSLPNIMKAKSKPMDCIEWQTLQCPVEQHIEIVSVMPPEARSAGQRVDSVRTLVDKLKHEARVL